MLISMQLFISVYQLIGLWERAPTTSFLVPFIVNQLAAHSPDKQAPYCNHIHMQLENCSSAVEVLHSGMMSVVPTINKYV